MNTLITIGLICAIGVGLYYLPQVARFIETFINFHFGGRYD